MPVCITLSICSQSIKMNDSIQCYLDRLFEPVLPPLSWRSPFTSQEMISIGAYVFIFAFGTVGNALVIKTYTFTGRKERAGSRFVAILAGADILSCVWIPVYEISKIVCVFGELHVWPFGEVTCYVLHPWISSLYFFSAWILVATSLERAR